MYKSSEIIIESYSGGYHLQEFRKKYPKHLGEAKALTLAAYMQMFLVDGVIHADCHHGNMKYEVTKNGKIKVHFLDCGVVTKLDYKMRKSIVDMMNALAANQQQALVSSVVKMSKTDVDTVKFESMYTDRVITLRANTRNGNNSSLTHKINMLLDLLAKSNACVDGEIVSFLIGYSLIESGDDDAADSTLTRRAFEIIKDRKAFKTTRNNARQMETAINSVFRG